MPGAGSGKAAAYVYSIAPKDGTTIGALMPGVIIDPLLQKHSTGGFDATKFTYLGSADSDARVCITGPSSKITTFDQAMSQKTTIAATPTGGSTSDYAFMTKNATGAKLDIVNGYKGTARCWSPSNAARAKGLCGSTGRASKTQRSQWLHDRLRHVHRPVGRSRERCLGRFAGGCRTCCRRQKRSRQASRLAGHRQTGSFSDPTWRRPACPLRPRRRSLRDALAAVCRDSGSFWLMRKARLGVHPGDGRDSATDRREALRRLAARWCSLPSR